MLKTKKLLKKNQNSRYFHIELLELKWKGEGMQENLRHADFFSVKNLIN